MCPLIEKDLIQQHVSNRTNTSINPRVGWVVAVSVFYSLITHIELLTSVHGYTTLLFIAPHLLPRIFWGRVTVQFSQVNRYQFS